eukprot:TRINITY_DN6323_c0_g2_i29.p1 TRINITY_DN6323_c0_g2~~TRINITY_DN6323_c0_g2_i29.p1  ORF type:complete len:400 (-),score=32.88 TRINITY_DN6323_c0_g2_i29:37-1236(-)
MGIVSFITKNADCCTAILNHMFLQSYKQRRTRSDSPGFSIITQVSRDDQKTTPFNNSEANSSKISKLWTSIKSLCRCLGLQRLLDINLRSGLVQLPPQSEKNRGRKTLVLDLDETLVHSTFDHMSSPDLKLDIKIEGSKYKVKVKKRPGVEQFLKEMAEIYEIVLFTASLSDYAIPVLQSIDTDGVIDYKLYRQHCTFYRGIFVKDLSRLGRDLKDIIIVDNSENSFLFQPTNAFLIKNFFDDVKDIELPRLSKFLKFLANVYDVRPVHHWKEVFDKGLPIQYQSMTSQLETYHTEPKTLPKKAPVQQNRAKGGSAAKKKNFTERAKNFDLDIDELSREPVSPSSDETDRLLKKGRDSSQNVKTEQDEAVVEEKRYSITQDNFNSVSYTHLTLPTIYSV